MTFEQVIAIALAIILVWWPIGGLINRRRGQAWVDWLTAGVFELGANSTYKWLKSFHSVGQLTVRELRAPFKTIEVLITLESRDNLIIWLLRHLRGRRDEMIIQADIQGNPMQELEVGYRGRRSYDSYLAQQKENSFTQLPERDGFRIARRGKDDPEAVMLLSKFLAAEGQAIQRMSLQRNFQEDPSLWSRRQANNLLLRADMTKIDAQSPATFFAALREWIAGVALDAEEEVGDRSD